MTNLEAAEILGRMHKCGVEGCPVVIDIPCEECPYNVTEEQGEEVFRMAIEALRKQSEIPTDSDMIRRRKALERMSDICFMCDERDGGYCGPCKYDELVDAVKETPSAQPEHKGEWLRVDGYEKEAPFWKMIRMCSRCEMVTTQSYRFCPNCGADMRGGKT